MRTSIIAAFTLTTFIVACGETDTTGLNAGTTSSLWDYSVNPANLGQEEIGAPGDTFVLSSFTIHGYRAIQVNGFEIKLDKIHDPIWLEIDGARVETTARTSTDGMRRVEQIVQPIGIEEDEDTTLSLFGTVIPDWNYTEEHQTRMTPVLAFLPSGDPAKVEPGKDVIERTYKTVAR